MTKKIFDFEHCYSSEITASVSNNHLMKTYILLLLVFLLFSCASPPFVKDKTGSGNETVKKADELQPGDTKVVDGVEYIYASNRRFMLTPSEPEYVWIRKDQYTPRIGENLFSGRMTKREKDELENKISRLEEELRKRGTTPQTSSDYPSLQMKRRIMVLPIEDNKEGGLLGKLITERLITRLERTNAVICISPESRNMKGQLTDIEHMKMLNEVYDIQAILKGSISDLSTNINLLFYNTETGAIMKQFSEGNVEYASIDLIIDDLLKIVLKIDWHARITSIENDKVYINAGRLSGLETGVILEVYSPGSLVMYPKTNTPLGRVKGIYKGELRISELFGIDASLARLSNGSNFSTSDLVYVKNN